MKEQIFLFEFYPASAEGGFAGPALGANKKYWLNTSIFYFVFLGRMRSLCPGAPVACNRKQTEG
ncbi:hypothetical protein A2303_00105 [Candidatus Falkowbacteria bacterium RIFOXYB2_FULL_47_14]|uniref:Uncharacterized protein n=1 Tax=Candidatus Falkowbacteria bacterium RIFOXYA2_FULL_47_19 TaxID=1797994 RepID=A0A1F5SN48_9BACT|nr:MAG: hypothetical protein A2227_01385 [Candidatus Falkowbacteria bacterium RIFOXYA2_FULL_47_19]OGF36817.1 MAG: hypothetical protein A2468_03380 [Candidatus Falkowbacteria bacterium RIFOXYC2_FULL_46_15]OGF44057.1 MAG: hypothetical protein A2303_00105 [Candidatus Falkowbacteria bacterium RIFOXYB2_FULL_47_14]